MNTTQSTTLIYDVQPFPSAHFDVLLYTADEQHSLRVFAARLPLYRYVVMPTTNGEDASDESFDVTAVKALHSVLALCANAIQSLDLVWYEHMAPTDAHIRANPRSLFAWVDYHTHILAQPPRSALHIAYSSSYARSLLRCHVHGAKLPALQWRLLHAVPPLSAVPLAVPCVIADLQRYIAPDCALGEDIPSTTLRWLHSWPANAVASDERDIAVQRFVVFTLDSTSFVLTNTDASMPTQVLTSAKDVCDSVERTRMRDRPPLLLCDTPAHSAIRTHRQRLGVIDAPAWLLCNVDEYVLNASLDASGNNAWHRTPPQRLPLLCYSKRAHELFVAALTQSRVDWLKHYDILAFSLSLAHLAHMPWSAALAAWPKHVAEALLGKMVASEQRCVMLPLQRNASERTTYKGAHVQRAMCGLHSNCFVALLDSRSHYPSVFRWSHLEPHLCSVFEQLVRLRRAETRAQHAHVLKYLANSLYGGLAVVDYDTASLAARTAEAGRTVLTRVIALLQDSGNDGTFSSLLSIIGGDTDALLVRINDATITNADQAEALLRTRVLPFINTSLGEPIEFSLQWIACSLYMHSMKQYAYLDARTRTITCKGLEEVRGSTPRALQQALQHATEAILHSDDNASAAKTLATYVCNTRETLTLQEDPAQAFIMIPRHARTTAHREPYTLADSYDANRPQEVYVRDLLSPAQAPRSINIDYCIKTHFLRPIERRITVLTNNTSNSGDNGGDDEDNAQAGDDDDDDDEQDSSDDRRVVVAAAAAAAAAAAVSNVEDEMKE